MITIDDIMDAMEEFPEGDERRNSPFWSREDRKTKYDRAVKVGKPFAIFFCKNRTDKENAFEIEVGRFDGDGNPVSREQFREYMDQGIVNQEVDA